MKNLSKTKKIIILIIAAAVLICAACIGVIAFVGGGFSGHYGIGGTTWLHFVINTLIGLLVAGLALWLFAALVRKGK